MEAETQAYFAKKEKDRDLVMMAQLNSWERLATEFRVSWRDEYMMTWRVSTIGGRVVESDEVENKMEQIASKPKFLKNLCIVIRSVLRSEKHASV